MFQPPTPLLSRRNKNTCTSSCQAHSSPPPPPALRQGQSNKQTVALHKPPMVVKHPSPPSTARPPPPNKGASAAYCSYYRRVPFACRCCSLREGALFEPKENHRPGAFWLAPTHALSRSLVFGGQPGSASCKTSLRNPGSRGDIRGGVSKSSLAARQKMLSDSVKEMFWN